MRPEIAAAEEIAGPLPVPFWERDALAFLVAPLRPEAFLADSYERLPFVAHHDDPARSAGLLTLERVDRFLAEAELQGSMARLANHHAPVDPDSYVDGQGRIDPAALAAGYHRGSTIVLNELHESLPELGRFCRAVEAAFSCMVSTNIYLTPPGNQGFPPHYDNHDVFVLQVSGRKLWRLWENAVATPYRGERFEQSGFVAEKVSREFVLEPGDCAYIPRGLMHDAENVGEAPSLHITVGLFTKKWAELMLEAVSALALREPAFRRALPPGFATRDFDRGAAQAYFQGLLSRVAAGAEMDGAFDLLADSFLRSRRPDLRGVVAQGPAGEGEPFRLRPSLAWNVAEDEEGRIVLIGPGRDLAFAPADGDALDQVLSGEPFRARDLAGGNGAALVSTLWSQGWLERATP